MLELLQIAPNTITYSQTAIVVVSIVGWVISLCGLYFALKHGIEKNKTKIESVEKDHDTNVRNLKEKLIEAKTKKEAMKAEFSLEIEKKDELTHKRIDAIRTDFKEHQTSSNNEFKVVSSNLSEIKGMLTLLMERKS